MPRGETARARLRRAVLLLAPLALALWLPGAPEAPAVALGAAPPGTDFLYAQPASGTTVEALAHALGGPGWALDVLPTPAGVRVAVPAGGDPDALARRIASSRLVRSVEGDAVVRAAQLPSAPDEAPLDPLYELQRPYLEAIGAPAAWARGVDAGQVVIAVIDTGVDFDHLDLVDRIQVNLAEDFFDGRDNDGSGCADDIVGCNFVSLPTADPSCGYTTPPPHWNTRDDEGHGTFVAGVAAATHNELGVAGIARNAMVLPVKVLDCTATGRISDAAAGIRYAADRGAHVINISFGTPGDSPALREAVEYAQARGAVVVASAGNDGSRGITFPAAYPGVLSVAASGVPVLGGEGLDYRATAPFAQFGPGVDFLAPGVDLVSTVPAVACAGSQWRCVEGEAAEADRHAIATGSSFATPVVAGAVAVMLAAHPERSPEFVVSMLLSARHARLAGQQAQLIDLAGAVQREVLRSGMPGTSRHSGGAPSAPGP